MRQFLLIVIPLLLPTLFYLLRQAVSLWLYKRMVDRQQDKTPEPKKIIDITPEEPKRIPWIDLLIIGVLLSILTMVGYALMGGDTPNGKRVPAHIEDGRIVPSYIEKE